MDGIHDLGGMQGFGPVAHALADGELAFDTPWQGRVFALAAAVVEHAFGGDREPFPARARQGHRDRARPSLLGKLGCRARSAGGDPTRTTRDITQRHWMPRR